MNLEMPLFDLARGYVQNEAGNNDADQASSVAPEFKMQAGSCERGTPKHERTCHAMGAIRTPPVADKI